MVRIFRVWRLVLLFAASLGVAVSAAWGLPQAYPKVVIGVLDNRGADKTMQDWQSLAESLKEALPEYDFSIAPLNFSSVEMAVASRAVDFVIANPAIYVTLEYKYNVSRLATLKNEALGTSVSSFGSAVFFKAGRDDIREIKDLRGKRVAATDKRSLGGWLAARGEFQQAGLTPKRDFASLEFLGSHDGVVRAVLEGKVDVGVVRTDTLERMAREGALKLTQVRVLPYADEDKGRQNFPYLCSTRLYPEWAIAKLLHASEDVARQITAALLSMPERPLSARNPKVSGWTVPVPYTPVRELLQRLKHPPYERYGEATLVEFVRQNLWTNALMALLLLGLAVCIVYFRRVSRKLGQANARIKLELRERVLTEERLIAEEAKLRLAEAELRVLANSDSLTGLLNRRRFTDAAESEIARANRHGHWIGLLILDIDRFKSINDTHGHPVGDEVLIRLAQILNAEVRSEDLVARIGGEEFAALMPETGVQGARILAERLRGRIQRDPVCTTTGLSVPFTVSVGVAALPGDKVDYTTLYRLADHALYLAKQSGRNCVKVAEA